MPAPLVKIDLEFPYTRSVGPVIGAYLDGLQERRLLASRARGRTLSPPLEYDPATGAAVEPELVERRARGRDHVASSNPIGASGMIRFAEAAFQVQGKAGEHHRGSRSTSPSSTYRSAGTSPCGWRATSWPRPARAGR